MAASGLIDRSIIDEGLELRMDLAQRTSSLVHSLRKHRQVQIKVRQPLQKILIPVSDEKMKQNIEAVKPLILTEVNIKDIEYPDDSAEQVLVKNIKPNFKKLKRITKLEMNWVGRGLAIH